MQNKVEFKVVAVSSNTNSFGLYQLILLSRSGEAFSACKSDPPPQGTTVSIPVGADGMISSSTAFHFEIPHKLGDAEQHVVDKLWKREITHNTDKL